MKATLALQEKRRDLRDEKKMTRAVMPANPELSLYRAPLEALRLPVYATPLASSAVPVTVALGGE